jgi:hypothetical protein
MFTWLDVTYCSIGLCKWILTFKTWLDLLQDGGEHTAPDGTAGLVTYSSLASLDRLTGYSPTLQRRPSTLRLHRPPAPHAHPLHAEGEGENGVLVPGPCAATEQSVLRCWKEEVAVWVKRLVLFLIWDCFRAVGLGKRTFILRCWKEDAKVWVDTGFICNLILLQSSRTCDVGNWTVILWYKVWVKILVLFIIWYCYRAVGLVMLETEQSSWDVTVWVKILVLFLIWDCFRAIGLVMLNENSPSCDAGKRKPLVEWRYWFYS